MMIDPEMYRSFFETMFPYSIIFTIIGLIIHLIYWIKEKRKKRNIEE